MLFLWSESYHIEKQNYRKIYLCSIGYAKVFDKVQHEELKEKLDLYGKLIQIIRYLCLKQAACMQIINELIGDTKIERTTTRMRFRIRFIQTVNRIYAKMARKYSKIYYARTKH